MKKLLEQISIKAIELGESDFSEKQIIESWLGRESATQSDINHLEKRLGVVLPDDYKLFLKMSNGFKATTHVDITFEPTDRVDYLSNFENYNGSLSFYDDMDGYQEISLQFKKSILIGGIEEEQIFLLLPPVGNMEKWRYWQFANWIPGEEEYENLEAHFIDVLNLLEELIEEKDI
ncbi:SMI1/KNR4 family protein [Nonlabens sp. Asnod3-H03]|uniref:SMI1/KNR4 family protein n=1 Tax=Nonlabens sp. Asnod3-H03 TaxID=3160580 RepID=UPI003866F4E1